jgi:hypothetical protein
LLSAAVAAFRNPLNVFSCAAGALGMFFSMVSKSAQKLPVSRARPARADADARAGHDGEQRSVSLVRAGCRAW